MKNLDKQFLLCIFKTHLILLTQGEMSGFLTGQGFS